MDFSQLLARLKALTANFTTTQLVTLGVTFVLVVGIVGGSAYWLNAPTYTLLFADIDPDSAAQVIEKLKTLKVQYQVDPGGRTIRVQSERIDELRLQLTAEGLPSSGRIGFEIFDRTAFGATEFLEHVNYRRALEGEIGRTISTLAEVGSARVHITMGKDSLFGESRPAKASVVLKLRGQKPLSNGTVNGITNLVAASVEGLRPEAVVILDNFGRPLAKPNPDDGDPLGAAQLERQQRMERDLAARVVALLEPVVGEDRVRVNVALKLNAQSREETEERWDPTSIVRSKQTSSDVATPGNVPMLVAGARGNTPPPSPDGKTVPQGAPGVTATLPGSSRQAETTNYELSRTTKRIVEPRGDVARLSVAVILDDDQALKKEKDGTAKVTRVPRSREELQKIQGLVAAAVGLDAQRGDQLTVENVAFDEPVIEDPGPVTIMQKFAPQIQEASRLGTVLLLALVAFLLVIRPAMRKMGLLPEKEKKSKKKKKDELEDLPVLPEVTVQAPKTVAELESEIEAQLDAAANEKISEWRKVPVLTRKVTKITQNEPEQVAKLLKTWMADQGR
jgi:flagellar M-ring protein FliF